MTLWTWFYTQSITSSLQRKLCYGPTNTQYRSLWSSNFLMSHWQSQAAAIVPLTPHITHINRRGRHEIIYSGVHGLHPVIYVIVSRLPDAQFLGLEVHALLSFLPPCNKQQITSDQRFNLLLLAMTQLLRESSHCDWYRKKPELLSCWDMPNCRCITQIDTLGQLSFVYNLKVQLVAYMYHVCRSR